MTSPAPDRDRKTGLYPKFIVTRRDGGSVPSGKHDGCNYFVLDVTHDKHADAALLAYAASCEAEYPLLAADLRDLAAQPMPLPPVPVEPAVREQLIQWKAELNREPAGCPCRFCAALRHKIEGYEAALALSPGVELAAPRDPEAVIERILRRVAELPDRTSPDDWPEAMLVTTQELSAILTDALQPPAACGAASQEPTCESCVHLTPFELTDELFTCPVVNIRIHRDSASVFGCNQHEARVTFATSTVPGSSVSGASMDYLNPSNPSPSEAFAAVRPPEQA